jgi:hypothetical protein
MTRIVEHLSVADLERRYRAARDVTEARHTQAVWLLAQGRTVLDVAGVLAFAPRWVEQLAARYNAHGPAVLGGAGPRFRRQSRWKGRRRGAAAAQRTGRERADRGGAGGAC